MNAFKIYISLFFFICLFTVAFIPQLCLDAIEDLQDVELNGDLANEESANGLNIFEEESKNHSEESNQETNHLIVKILHSQQHHLQNIFENKTKNFVQQQDKYQSIYCLIVSPPPQA